MHHKDDAIRRAEIYAEQKGLTLDRELGEGSNGVVCAAKGLFSNSCHSAIKSCEREGVYARERDVYLRLLDKQITRIRGCEVPKLLGYDDDLWVIEMTIVNRPFCLDFGGAYLEKPPDFSEEVMADWEAEKIEQFGKYWPEVKLIIAVLQVHGIYLMDVHPKNISFEP